MFAFVTPDSTGGNFGDSISCLINYEVAIATTIKDVEIFTDYVSINQINNVVYNTSDFVNDLFETQDMFDSRQFSVMDIANSIFKNSRSLNSFEESALNEAFKLSLIDKPTLKGRR